MTSVKKRRQFSSTATNSTELDLSCNSVSLDEEEEEEEDAENERSRRATLSRCFHGVVGHNFEEYVSTLRKVIWLAAVSVCCYFMIYQVRQLKKSLVLLFFPFFTT